MWTFCVTKGIYVMKLMKEYSKWVSEKEVGEILGVDEKYLKALRELGYLRPGTHWRSSLDPKQLPWSPKVLYHTSSCTEIIEKREKNDSAVFDHMAA